MSKIKARESQNVEYKSSWHDEYLKWICGFANAQGAVMYFGVDNDHEVVGLEKNEGELPTGYTQETLYGHHSSKPRNLNIANAFFKAGFIDTWGRGYKIIREGFEPAGIPMPKVENFCGGVQVTIERTQFMKMINGGNGGKDGGNVPSLSQTLSPVLSQVVTSLSQACPKLKGNRLENAAKTLFNLFNAPHSLKVLMESVGESNRGRMKDNVLAPLLDAGLIELTIPDSPNSPKQKYALTEKGKGLFKVEGLS